MVNDITDEEILDAIRNEIEDAILDVMEKYNIGSINITAYLDFQGDCFGTDTKINHCYESAYEYPCRPHSERGKA